MMIDSELIKSALPLLLQGALVTLHITFFAVMIGFLMGTVIGYAHVYAFKPLRWLISCYVTLIRGTPMLIQITFFYFVLPSFGIILSNFWTAVIAIGVNSGAYMSQIVVAGINAISRGQIEAAKVLGFSSMGIARYIVLPQAFRIMVPALAGECITLVKDSSLASIIGVMELYKEARSIINQSYDVITIFCLVALLYLAMTTLIALLFHALERKMGWYVKGN
jgi:His/Glu/Gln/Arg/opine family amino acid ABC transporter permease subunit